MARRYDCSTRRTGLPDCARPRPPYAAASSWCCPPTRCTGSAPTRSTPTAVGDLLEAKGRGRNMPAPVLVGSPNTLHGLVTDFSEQAGSSSTHSGRAR